MIEYQAPLGFAAGVVTLVAILRQYRPDAGLEELNLLRRDLGGSKACGANERDDGAGRDRAACASSDGFQEFSHKSKKRCRGPIEPGCHRVSTVFAAGAQGNARLKHRVGMRHAHAL